MFIMFYFDGTHNRVKYLNWLMGVLDTIEKWSNIFFNVLVIENIIHGVKS